MVNISETLLAAILAAEVVRLGFDARLLARQSKMSTKLKVLWEDYTSGDDDVDTVIDDAD